MATCRMFYQDNNKTTSAINPNHAKTQNQHKASVVTGQLDTRTTDDTSKSVSADDEGPSTSMQVENTSNVSKNTNGKVKKDGDDGSLIDESNAGGDKDENVLTPNSSKGRSSDEGGFVIDETDGGGQNRTNRRSLSSSFVTEEEDNEDDVDQDKFDKSKLQTKIEAQEGDSSLALARSNAASTSCYNIGSNTRSLNRNCTKSDGEVAFNNSNNSNTFESDANFLTSSQLAGSTKEELVQAYKQLQAYIDIRNNNYEDEISQLKSSIEKYHTRQVEASRRENILVMKLRTKEQEMEEYVAQINELKSAVVPTTGVLKTSLIDPSVNFIVQNMKKELQETKKKLQDAQDDLVAWKFTPDSNTGKRLMAKCKMLYVENEELGKMINGGRVAKLENDLTLQKTLTQDLRKSQTDMVELVHELDEDVEGMQSTIFYLQQQLRERSKDGDPTCSASDLPLATDDTSGVDATKCLVSSADLCSKCKAKLSSETINLRTNSRRTTKDCTDMSTNSTPTPTLRHHDADDNTDDGENQRTHLVNGLMSSDAEDDNSLTTNNNQSVTSTINCSAVDEPMETNESDGTTNNAIMTKQQLQTNSSEHEHGVDPDVDEQPFKKSKLFHHQSDEASNSNQTTTTAITSANSECQQQDDVPSSSSLNGGNE